MTHTVSEVESREKSSGQEAGLVGEAKKARVRNETKRGHCKDLSFKYEGGK